MLLRRCWQCSFSCVTHAPLWCIWCRSFALTCWIPMDFRKLCFQSLTFFQRVSSLCKNVLKREVNMSCTILHFVSDPNWRPTFRYHHWSISLIAAALCVGVLSIFFQLCEEMAVDFLFGRCGWCLPWPQLLQWQWLVWFHSLWSNRSLLSTNMAHLESLV